MVSLFNLDRAVQIFKPLRLGYVNMVAPGPIETGC